MTPSEWTRGYEAAVADWSRTDAAPSAGSVTPEWWAGYRTACADLTRVPTAPRAYHVGEPVRAAALAAASV